MKEETKDLTYFKQQAAEYYGFNNWSDFMIQNEKDHLALETVMNKVSELYASFSYEQGSISGYKSYKKQSNDLIKKLNEDNKYAEIKGWNESIYHCLDISSISEDKREMLNSLKSEK